VAGDGIPAAAVGQPCDAASGLCAEVLRGGETRLCQPFEPRAPLELPGMAPLKSGAAAPIRLGGAVEGLVLVAYHGDRWLEREEVELLSAFAELGGIASGNAADHAAAQRAAAHDSLTGCLNHGAFQDRLREEIARAARNNATLAVVLMDLDHFKSVNDTFGHLAGDAVLRGTADALRESVRAYDQVARYGGDEFALLLPNTDQDAARRIVDRAQRAISRVQLPGTASVSAGAGIAHWRAHEDATSLIARADRALLDVKRARQRLSGGEGGERAPLTADQDRDRDRLRRLATAGNVGTRLGRLLDQRSIAETVVLELAAALGYERCLLARQGPGDEVTVVATGRERSTSAPAPGDGDGDVVGDPGVAPEASPTLRLCVRERRTVFSREETAGGSSGSSGATRSSESSGSPTGRTGGAELAVPIYAGSRLWGAVSVALDPSATPSELDDDDAQVLQTVADHVGTALHTAELYERLDRTHLGTAEALAAAMEAKDRYTADHAHSIADLAVAVGRELGLEDEALRDLRYGAIFHDIGKIAIPDGILNKPGPLSDEEFAVIRRHPAVGEQILAPVPFLSEVRQIVRHDHERWDGGGYPDGLREEEIPLGARVVLVVDAYHAMRSNRPYRAALGADAARTELLRHAGTQFDPRVVEALLVVLQRQAQGQAV
jgi:diguanylate cyclase (GGDEF)-like protein/putative nucleotidyltransferase with HDIG domain